MCAEYNSYWTRARAAQTMRSPCACAVLFYLACRSKTEDMRGSLQETYWHK